MGGSLEPELVGNRNQTDLMVFLMAFGFQGWGFMYFRDARIYLA